MGTKWLNLGEQGFEEGLPPHRLEVRVAELFSKQVGKKLVVLDVAKFEVFDVSHSHEL